MAARSLMPFSGRFILTVENEWVPALLHWFDETKRDLPWRANHPRDPYHVWVSEIMLQQTRTETVKDYYVRWMAAFPTVSALAQASEEEVLKLWQGLGYYSRARNLHKAAREIVLQYHGIFPIRWRRCVPCPASVTIRQVPFYPWPLDTLSPPWMATCCG